jgi:hypothetical protein
MLKFIPSAALAVGLVAATGFQAFSAQRSAGTITIQRDPGCGCCLKWVSYLEQAGFTATVTESSEMAAIKKSKGVPDAARSCHTGTIDGYVVEGHVPAADIKRMLKERPAIVGIGVPGMPAGSPGMEVASGLVQPFDVVAFDKAGRLTVFASHAGKPARSR